MGGLTDILRSGQVYTIAEMSANHAGKLENALSIVHAAKQAGASCLKIQTYTADSLTLQCDNPYFKIQGGVWDGYTLYDLYKEAATPYEWQRDIKVECDWVGLDFLSTPFDNAAVDFLEEIGVTFYKIASFELVDIPLIEYVASKGKPMILSCGMASIEEIEEAVNTCKVAGNQDIMLLKCTSEYPVNPTDMNLSTIPDMQARFNLPIGLSDHSLGCTAAVAAVALGAQAVEKHFCLSRDLKNPDSSFSCEPAEFAQLVQAVGEAAAMRGQVCYGVAGDEKENQVFRKSVFAAANIKKGEALTAQNIRVVRPGYGAKPKYFKKLLSISAPEDLPFGQPVPESWVE